MLRQLLSAGLAVLTLQSGQRPAPTPVEKIISQSVVQALSEAAYFKILQNAYAAGWRYSPSDIRSGMKRNLQEWKARLIDKGFVIVTDDPGPGV